MGVVTWLNPALGKFAVYDSNGTSGAADNPAAPRNAPLGSPASHLDKIYMHSDLDMMEVSHGPTAVTVSHALVAAGTGAPGGAGMNGILYYPSTVTSHVLLTHSLGYVPDAMVVLGGDVIYPGQAVQTLSDGRTRCVAIEVTTTQVILHEWAVRSSATMAAVSLTYTVIVFRSPPAPSGNVLFHFNPATGIVQACRGKFQSDRRYLQVVSGGSPFGFSKGRTIDLNNGAIRYVDPDGSQTEVIPASAGMVIRMSGEPSDAPWGPSMAYGGSFTGSPAALVQVP